MDELIDTLDRQLLDNINFKTIEEECDAYQHLSTRLSVISTNVINEFVLKRYKELPYITFQICRVRNIHNTDILINMIFKHVSTINNRFNIEGIISIFSNYLNNKEFSNEQLYKVLPKFIKICNDASNNMKSDIVPYIVHFYIDCIKNLFDYNDKNLYPYIVDMFKFVVNNIKHIDAFQETHIDIVYESIIKQFSYLFKTDFKFDVLDMLSLYKSKNIYFNYFSLLLEKYINKDEIESYLFLERQ